jgi:hypothetical protein
VREIGPRLHMAFRKTRVTLWRFKRSPEQQDRAAMFATFAFIGLFAVGSVDAVITGGADFAPGSAYAAEYTPVRMTPVVAPVVEQAAEEAAPEEAVKMAGEVDYSFTTEVLLGAPEPELAVIEEVQGFAFDTDKLKVSEPVAGTLQAETIL